MLEPPKFLPTEVKNDEAALDALSSNKKIKCKKFIEDCAINIKAGYEQYRDVKGNARLVKKVAISGNTSECLRKLFASPPKDIAYIRRFRRESEVNCCPMCGSFHSGTLDHLLPKSKYAEFAIFSLNLVPACKCNSIRGEEAVGANPEERVLHPYFDHVLSERLITSRFEDLGPAPQILLNHVLKPGSPSYNEVEYHIKSIVYRTSVRRYLQKKWSELLRRPSLIAAELKAARISKKRIKLILSEELQRVDEIHGSKNNWNSIFISGIMEEEVINWLFVVMNTKGRKPDAPLIDGLL